MNSPAPFTHGTRTLQLLGGTVYCTPPNGKKSKLLVVDDILFFSVVNAAEYFNMSARTFYDGLKHGSTQIGGHSVRTPKWAEACAALEAAGEAKLVPLPPPPRKDAVMIRVESVPAPIEDEMILPSDPMDDEVTTWKDQTNKLRTSLEAEQRVLRAKLKKIEEQLKYVPKVG